MAHVEERGIQAFRDICVASLPDFVKAEAFAKKYGIVKVDDFTFSRSGMNADKTLSVQIKANRECAITTPSKSDETLTVQFIKVVGAAVRRSGAVGAMTEAMWSPIAQATRNVSGQRWASSFYMYGAGYVFAHDRSGGEAYVILRK